MANVPAVDITEMVAFGSVDDDLLPLVRCVCGQQFIPWDFVLREQRDEGRECPNCERRMWFETRIRVFCEPHMYRLVLKNPDLVDQEGEPNAI